ncbi:MAG: hypothetical protein AAF739_01365 [Pseudomonadota bacterium]
MIKLNSSVVNMRTFYGRPLKAINGISASVRRWKLNILLLAGIIALHSSPTVSNDAQTNNVDTVGLFGNGGISIYTISTDVSFNNFSYSILYNYFYQIGYDIISGNPRGIYVIFGDDIIVRQSISPPIPDTPDALLSLINSHTYEDTNCQSRAGPDLFIIAISNLLPAQAEKCVTWLLMDFLGHRQDPRDDTARTRSPREDLMVLNSLIAPND